MAPRVQAALDAALQDEDDITLDAKYEYFMIFVIYIVYFLNIHYFWRACKRY